MAQAYKASKYAALLKALHTDSEELEKAWQMCIDDNDWPEEEQLVEDRFKVAVDAVRAIVEYRDECRVGHLGT